jgi:hypothetical protein
VLGQDVPIVGMCERLLSRVPSQDLERLRRRGTVVVYAPSIVEALESDWSALRRGRSLSAEESGVIRKHLSMEAGAAAAYDSQLDAVIIPTRYRPLDLERALIHELGHALTFRAATCFAADRSDLLLGLPRDIARHVRAYEVGRSPEAVAERVHEVLAEAYVMVVNGHHDELPGAVMSVLHGILSGVTPGDDRRWCDVDLHCGRTASFVDPSKFVTSEDLEVGHELAPASGPVPLKLTRVGDPRSVATRATEWRLPHP